MSTAHIIAQLCMLATLILMITGKTPIYMTAIVGAAISALIAGFPMAGGTGMTVTKMIVSGLNPCKSSKDHSKPRNEVDTSLKSPV